MKPFLLFKEKDFDSSVLLPWNAADIIQDLGLNVLFKAMAGEDELLWEVAQKTLLTATENDIGTIFYRQEILKDCLDHPSEIKEIYATAQEAIDRRKKSWFGVFTNYPSSVLSGSREMILLYIDELKKLRGIAENHRSKFRSAGFKRFFEMIMAELSGDYFEEIEKHLQELRLDKNLVMSARLGKGNKGIRYTLHPPEAEKLSWWQKIFGQKAKGYTFYIHPRDESGSRALRDLKDRGLNEVANALGQSSDHILEFFKLLRTELSFYLGCLNLHSHLSGLGEPLSFPQPLPSDYRAQVGKGLYDPCLAISMNRKVIASDIKTDNKNPVIITGANQGGKSTFLRSIGVAQLMMQNGMFVPADFYSAGICNSLFTHFKREEDTTMKSGKFDEELARMSQIADHITPDAIVLFNESFAATNEIEGSEIAGQIVRALIEKGVRVFYVTHLYDFASNIYKDGRMDALFLRAERKEDASRTFRITEGRPLVTSYGQDLYYKIFKNDVAGNDTSDEGNISTGRVAASDKDL
ncbi:MAG TPA: hypothetical protein VG847_14415 [Chitinophagaceae bacterium]|nr:hypothetical protein [Chitinophagaceae bacterium]